MTEPEIIKVKAVDIAIYEYGIWCSIEGGEPFVNPIVYKRWQEDGENVFFGLDSHSCISARWDDLVRVVKIEQPVELLKSLYLQEQSEFLGRRPSPKQKCVTCGAVRP